MSDIATQCLEVARNRRTCAGMDAALERIAELEARLEKAIEWIQHDCPWSKEEISKILEKTDE